MRIFKLEINKNRVYGLDILRAFAILFVLFQHAKSLLPSQHIPKIILKLYSFPILDGVSIFFVLSGFLIGGILIKILNENKTFSIKLLVDFWKRRWFRTLPNYYLILLILIVLELLFRTIDFSEISRYFYFFQNFSSIHPPFFREAWSLSVEEWFYLLIPFLILVFIKVLKLSFKNSILLVALTVIVVISSFIYRFQNVELNGIGYASWDMLFEQQVITRLDSLIYGFLAAYVYIYFIDFWEKYKCHFFILGVLIIFTQRNVYSIK